jgi:hypothetical protein
LNCHFFFASKLASHNGFHYPNGLHYPSFLMQKSFSSRSFFALSATMLALLPLSGTLQVYAAPNERRQNARDFDPDRLITFEAVVTRETRDGFQARVRNETFDVFSDADVREGDRVVLRGRFENEAEFSAQSVRVIGAGNGAPINRDTDNRDAVDRDPIDEFNDEMYQENGVNFPATITRVVSRMEVEVRGDNGRIYRVEMRDNTSGYRAGNQIRVQGEAVGLRVINAVFVDRGGDVPDRGNTEEPQEVDFPANIVRLGKTRGDAFVRGDNGVEYRVRGDEVEDFKVGDRVRVQGVARYGIIGLRSLDLLR